MRDGSVIVVHAYAVLSQITRLSWRMASLQPPELGALVCVSTLASLELEVNTRASRAVRPYR